VKSLMRLFLVQFPLAVAITFVGGNALAQNPFTGDSGTGTYTAPPAPPPAPPATFTTQIKLTFGGCIPGAAPRMRQICATGIFQGPVHPPSAPFRVKYVLDGNACLLVPCNLPKKLSLTVQLRGSATCYNPTPIGVPVATGASVNIQVGFLLFGTGTGNTRYSTPSSVNVVLINPVTGAPGGPVDTAGLTAQDDTSISEGKK